MEAVQFLGEHGKDSCQGDSGGPMVHFDESGEAVSIKQNDANPYQNYNIFKE